MRNIKRKIKLISCLLCVIFAIIVFALSIQWNRNESKNYRADGTNWKGYISGSLQINVLTEPENESYGTCEIAPDNHDYTAHNLVIPDAVKISGSFYYITQINYSFTYSQKLTGELWLPSKLEEIGQGAFYGCYQLTILNIPDSVTYIGYNALPGVSFNNLTIPSSVGIVDEFAFASVHIRGDLIIKTGSQYFLANSFLHARIDGKLVLEGGEQFFGIFSFNEAEIGDKIVFMEGVELYVNTFSTAKFSAIVVDGWTALPAWESGTQLRTPSENGTVKSINSPISSTEVLTFLKTRAKLPDSWSAI